MDKLAMYKEAIYKEAKNKDPNRTTFWNDRVWSTMKDGLAGGLVTLPVTAASLKLSKDPMKTIALLNGAGIAGAAGARAARLHNQAKKQDINLDAKDYGKAVAAIGASKLTRGLSAYTNTPEAIIKHKKRQALEKSAASEWKGLITRNNPEWQEHGGLSIKETNEKYTKKQIKNMLGSYGLGMGAGAATGAALASMKGRKAIGQAALAGAGLGSLGGAAVGTARNIQEVFKQSKADQEVFKSMIKSRLGEGATDEDIKKAVLKYKLTGFMPKK